MLREKAFEIAGKMFLRNGIEYEIYRVCGCKGCDYTLDTICNKWHIQRQQPTIKNPKGIKKQPRC